ncbi:hypothetical protein Tco_0003236 [Tanacetum coccineum]
MENTLALNHKFDELIESLKSLPKETNEEDLAEHEYHEKQDLGDALLHYDAEMELMNLILLSIPNEIYNSVDACTTAKEMWKRVEHLMRGTIQNQVDRETHFTNEFDQFVAEPGEALVSQFEKLVNAPRAKKLEKSHGPLALVAHTGLISFRNTAFIKFTNPKEVVEGSNAQNETENVQRNLFELRLQEILQLFNATTIVEKDIMLGIGQSQEWGFKVFHGTIVAGKTSEVDGSVEKDTHVPDLYALKQLARNAYLEAEKQQLFAQKVQQQNTTLTNQLELYKERVRVLENINGDNNYLNKFLEADLKAKHFNQQAQSQLFVIETSFEI